MNDAVRIRFEKTGLARYISHLDLQHTIQRSFARAGISVRHSNGFNPHPLMTIALPLPLGCESICEIMDFAPEDRPDPDELIAVMNRSLPDGIRFLEAYVPSRRVTEIRWICTEGIWKYEQERPAAEELQDLFSRPALPVEKKTKRGTAEIDLAQTVKEACFETTETGIHMTSLLSAQSPTVNPDLLLKAAVRYLPEFAVPTAVLYRRLEVLDEAGVVFR